MSFRTVVVEKRSKLDLRMGYLVIHKDNETIRIFLDEINTLIVENPACCLTGCLLVELTKRKVKVVFCDEKHSPYAELMPCYGHGECSGKLQEQIQWDKNFCQLLWARIIAEKYIIRQIFCLKKAKGKKLNCCTPIFQIFNRVISATVKATLPKFISMQFSVMDSNGEMVWLSIQL